MHLVSSSAEETSLAEARQQIEANFWGSVMITRAVLLLMWQQRTGRIITIGSLAGLIGMPFQPYYAASKHAIEGFFKSLRFEVAPFNIRVSVIEPGFFKSNLEQATEAAPYSIADYEVSRRIKKGPALINYATGESTETFFKFIEIPLQLELRKTLFAGSREAKEL